MRSADYAFGTTVQAELLFNRNSQYNKTVVAGMAVAVFGALGGNPFTAFSGAIGTVTGINPTKHPRGGCPVLSKWTQSNFRLR